MESLIIFYLLMLVYMGGHVCRWYLWGSYMCKQEDNTGCQFLGNVHLKKKGGDLSFPTDKTGQLPRPKDLPDWAS